MSRPYQFITVRRQRDVFCVRLKSPHVEDQYMDDLGQELTRLVDEERGRKIVMSLGPEEPDCLISVFLAKLISLQRRLSEFGGALALAHVSEHTRSIFGAAGLEKLFHFYADEASAAGALASD